MKVSNHTFAVCSAILLLLVSSDGFTTTTTTTTRRTRTNVPIGGSFVTHGNSYNGRVSSTTTTLGSKTKLGATLQQESSSSSFVLTKDQVNPLVVLGEGGAKEKWINAFGVWVIFVSLITCPVWLVGMGLVHGTTSFLNQQQSNDNNKDNNNKQKQKQQQQQQWDPNGAIFDFTGKLWSRAWLAMNWSYPTVTGALQEIGERDGPCMYVANHASWLDIPVLCTILDPVFKFIAKGELSKIPCIGHQLVWGRHILIDRDDRRSQLRSFKEGIAWLKQGVPIMAFPEGTRSPDGRLMEFKGGVFSMAVRQKVPIVPISISNTHAVMPANALVPVQNGNKKLSIYVHPAIDTTDRTEAELSELVKSALLSKLPKDQHPLPDTENVTE